MNSDNFCACFHHGDACKGSSSFLNPKFQASSRLLCSYRSVCVKPVQKSHCWFSHEVADI